jgi:hypothetical protein
MFDDARFLEYHGRIIGNVLEHDAVCADVDIVTDSNVAENLGARTDINVITNDGNPRLLPIVSWCEMTTL